jgi:ATP-dependent Clp protease adaptor protein ClpS
MVPYDKRQENTNPSGNGLRDHLLILHNDDFNTFDDVIDILVAFCNHDLIQAEQCATLTHHMGFCEIKRGTQNELIDLQQTLSEQSLSVTID